MCLKADFTSERVGVVNNQSCQTRIRVISLIDLELLPFLLSLLMTLQVAHNLGKITQ